MNRLLLRHVCHARHLRRRKMTIAPAIRSRVWVLTAILCVSTLACDRPTPAEITSLPSNQITTVNAININTASADELQRIPHVGEILAAKIIEHRETNGPFRRVEHLMLIPGISDKRFRKIRPMVRVE